MAASTSFSVSSLTPKALPLSKPKSLVHASLLTPFSASVGARSVSLSLHFSGKLFEPLSSSRFTRNVAFSSEVEQDEETFSSEGEDEDSAPPPDFSADLKLFVGNLPFSVDSSQLADLFGSAGTVEMVEVIYDKMTGRSRGFAFVTMSTAEEAEAAAQQFNGYELEGRQLRVNAGPPPPKREGFAPRSPGGGRSSFDSNYRVHVGNLSWGVDDFALKSLFSEQGEVVDAKVIYDRESGRSRGFGFVTFSSEKEVNNAIDSLDGADLDGRPIRVTAAEARPPRRQF